MNCRTAVEQAAVQKAWKDLAQALEDYREECYQPSYNCRRAARQRLIEHEDEDEPGFENGIRALEGN